MSKKKILINGGISVAMAVASVVAIVVKVQDQAYARTADEIGAEIQQLQSQIEKAQKQAGELRAKSQSLQAELDTVAAQRTVIESQIKATRAQLEKLQIEIRETEKNIEKNRKILGTLLAKMSVEDELSPIERIAGSQNISTALDNFEYQSAAKNKLVERVNLIKEQKKALEVKKNQISANLEVQKNQESELAAKIAEQNRLIEITKSEEAEYNKYAEERNSRKAQLQQEQQRVIEEAARRAAQQAARNGGGASVSTVPIGGTSTYDQTWGKGCWVGADLYSHGGPNGNGLDDYGYGCGQCVSYTAFKLQQVFGIKALWWGNANMWPANARARGYATGRTPKVNSIGVISSGVYGHVVWVEGINANGTINISQYNWPVNGVWGKYSTMTVSPSMFDTYIYFN